MLLQSGHVIGIATNNVAEASGMGNAVKECVQLLMGPTTCLASILDGAAKAALAEP